jgi:2-C-methyl-D-erythritol 4-phosphate cytidylyltransferase
MITDPGKHAVREKRARTHERLPVAAGETLSVQEISELSNRVIDAMTDDELVTVIDAARPLLPHWRFDSGRLALRDRATLLRMACLARRACRNVRQLR